MPVFFIALMALLALDMGVAKSSSAASTRPVLSAIWAMVSLNSCAPPLAMASAPLAARTLPHRLANSSLLPPTASLKSWMTSPSDMPLAISSPKVFPVISFRPMLTADSLSASSVIMPLSIVVAFAVLMPCLVRAT